MSANSQKDDKHDVRPVAQGSRKDPDMGRKLKDVFISDNAGSVGDFLVWDVLVPGIKGMLQQAGHGLVDGIFGSGGRRYNGSTSYSRSSRYEEPSYRNNTGRPSYSYSRNEREYERRDARRRRSADSEVVLQSWGDAEAVRDGMIEYLERYGRVTVSDLNGLAGLSDRDFTDGEWGWEDISGAHIRTIRGYFEDGDGYALELPPPVYVK